MTSEIILVSTENMVRAKALPWERREIVKIVAIRFAPGSEKSSGIFDLSVKQKINKQKTSDSFADLATSSQHRAETRILPFPDAMDIFRLFCGETPVICYDDRNENIFREDCARNGIEFPFAEPWKKLATKLHSLGIDRNLHSAGSLHELTDAPMEGRSKSALNDVHSMKEFINFQLRRGNAQFLETLIGRAENPATPGPQAAGGTPERHPA